MTTATDILNAARAEIGLRESPPGSNHNKVTAWYGMNGSWCFMFVSYVFNKCNALDLIHGKHAYVPDIKSIFNPHGEFHTSSPHPGDLVSFDFNRSGEPEHIGIVEKVISGSVIQTIEGNTGGSGGDGVYRKTRSRSDVYAYATPKYSGPTSSSEDDDFMAEYISIDKVTAGPKKSRVETLAEGKWQQIYWNQNNSAASKKHHSDGDYPSVMDGHYYYNGTFSLRLTDLPKGAEVQVRALYTDAKTNAIKARCSVSEFVGSAGDTFITHHAVGYVPPGQKLRLEVAVYDIGDAKVKVTEGQVRLNGKAA